MKINFTRTIAVIVCSIIFASTIHSQEKPQALKFDEFTERPEGGFYSDDLEPDINERAERFITQLEKERGVRVLIFYYQGRITKRNYNNDFAIPLRNLKFRSVFSDKTRVQEFYIIDGGYRERAAVEFWIVPKNAESPAPTPTIDKAEAVICPSANVCRADLFDKEDTILFKVDTYRKDENISYKMKWKVSGGTIVGESNLSEVKIKLNDGVKQATAYVEFEDLPYPCPKIFSASSTVYGKRHLTDDFGRVTNEELEARLDGFLQTLFANPKAHAYIINYGSRATGRRDLVRREMLIRRHFVFRRIDTSRITLIDGGYRETEATEIWLSFDTNQKPVPTPTVDTKFVGTPAVKKSISRKR